MKLSLAITHFNRFDMVIDSFEQVLSDDRIDDIIIMDDASTDGSCERLAAHFKNEPKVRVLKEWENVGMSMNKAKSIGAAKNRWCITLDSDNKLRPDYIDAFFAIRHPLPPAFYMPEFAQPQFDYRAFAGEIISRDNIREYLDKPMFEQALNTCNMVVHRDTYLSIYKYNPEIKETDTLWMNYLWLEAGHLLYIVPGMQYDHRVHEGSGWLSNAQYNIKKGEELKTLIRSLK